MKDGSRPALRLNRLAARCAASLDDSRPTRIFLGKLVFAIGLCCFIVVQTGFVAVPVWKRALPPEVDDSLIYIMNATQLEECPTFDCPALLDFRRQSREIASDPGKISQKFLLEQFFIMPKPFFSLIQSGLRRLGLDPITALKVLWTLGPACFGLVFAYLLVQMFGRGPAGLGMGLLAFKVFPGQGLHYVVASNLTMAGACLVWARIMSRKGDAPWALMIGSLLLMAMHPIGRIYSMIAVGTSLVLQGISRETRVWLPSLLVLCAVAGTFVLPKFVSSLDFLPVPWPVQQSFLEGVGRGIVGLGVDLVRFESALFGSIIWFSGLAVFGFLTLNNEKKILTCKVLLVYFPFLIVSLFYVMPMHPADLTTRLWIPFIVIGFGLLGAGFWHVGKASLHVVREALESPDGMARMTLSAGWPLVALALIVGFSFRMVTLGVEGMDATVEYMMHRQEIMLDPAQANLLAERSKPEDRVLYDGLIPVFFYFAHGALDRGAVYYPAIRGTSVEKTWLDRPELRFAVCYNPLISLRSMQGEDENDWWISSPEMRFSDLSKPRRSRQVTIESKIPGHEVRYLEIESKTSVPLDRLTLMLENQGRAFSIHVQPVPVPGKSCPVKRRSAEIAANTSAAIDIDLKEFDGCSRFRVTVPPDSPDFFITGMTFGSPALNWPWSQKAELVLVPRRPDKDTVSVSFDPVTVLPELPADRKISVLNDTGATVLFEIAR